jgi:hypothetical protein
MPKKKKRSKAEMGKIRSKAFLKWRREKEPGAIMKPETTAKSKYRVKALSGRMK